ncbi:hypothetical protein CRE_02680 [Caenorhabditis remanei]|uniref:Uncharacterized protein n=1 Tax=Caenorhabditis remanei TaxID=31234 RepID=E3NHX4_CAERE|nr:hypothetical protein CRE_02680 [Caenorhabditis remanei]
MIIAFGFLLFLAISPCYSQSNSGSIKIVVVGKTGNANVTELFQETIDSIALFIAKNHQKAPQIYYHKEGDMCEYVGGIDRAKMRSDFILVVKIENTTKFDCDPEWGRQSFAVMNFHPSKFGNKIPFSGRLAFTSSESEADSDKDWQKVMSAKRLLSVLKPHFLSPQSRIPDEYPFKAEREERVKRRMLKAVIALMGLTVCSLLVIMFLGSLSRYNESKKLKEQELEKKKKHEQQAPLAIAPAADRHPEKSEKSEKSAATKTAISGKSGKSEKEPLLGNSSKSKKSEKEE